MGRHRPGYPSSTRILFLRLTRASHNVLRAIEAVAKSLGNTTSVCRKCYIHPDVLTCYMDGKLARVLEQQAGHELQSKLHTLLPEEAAVLALLVHGFKRRRNVPRKEESRSALPPRLQKRSAG